MGKEGDLWDDSALISAFDDAISKYKIMHSKKNRNTSVEGGKDVGGCGENASANGDESQEAKRNINIIHGHKTSSQALATEPSSTTQYSRRPIIPMAKNTTPPLISFQKKTHRDADEKSNVSSNTALDLGEASNLGPVKENHCFESFAPEPCIGSSNKQNMEDAGKGYSYSHGAEDYNKLLNTYYELEEKRQKILEQLQQYSGGNYQYSGEGYGSGGQWGTYSTNQEQPILASQVYHPNAVYSCCPCECPVPSCSSCPGCPFGGSSVCKTCVDDSVAMVPGKSCPLEDGNIVKTGMRAAEKAISSMRTKISGDPNVIEEKEKAEGETAQSSSSETDLTVVLNAWYSAGFHTGKYLTEQSIMKKQHN